MVKTIFLTRFLEDPDPSAGQPTRTVAYVFSRGLQDLLTVMIGLFSANVVLRGRMSPGFTGRFKNASTRPSLGRLHEFLMHLASQESSPVLQCLADKLKTCEAKKGWMKELIELRNRMQHRKKESPEQIEAQAAELLEAIPDFDGLGAIDLAGEDAPRWLSEDGRIPLEPFLWVEEGRVRVFTDFEEPDRLLFEGAPVPGQGRFGPLWKRLRLADPSLDSPTVVEFHDRIAEMTDHGTCEPPWWMDHIGKKGATGFLVEPGLLEGVLAGAKTVRPPASAVSLDLSTGEDPFQALAGYLALSAPPTWKDLHAYCSGDRFLWLAIRTGEMESRIFLKIIYWLSDASGESSLRVFVERDRALLARDQEALWDRLPDNLLDILRPPLRTSPTALPDYVWSRKRKRFLGIF